MQPTYEQLKELFVNFQKHTPRDEYSYWMDLYKYAGKLIEMAEEQGLHGEAAQYRKYVDEASRKIKEIVLSQ